MYQRRIKIGLLVLYFLVLIVSCIQPIYPDEMYLQHSVTILIALLLIYTTVRNSLSNKAFALIVAFMIFHIVGARWIYSYTPYDLWMKNLTGFSINTYFGFHRNQYDRLIHFLFGFMMMIPIREIYSKWYKCPARIAILLAFLSILSLSMLYEVFEWTISIFLSPADAEAYNGQQGDFWDAQKDMALAFLGALLMILVLQIGKGSTSANKN
jgi:putative membrane protein